MTLFYSGMTGIYTIFVNQVGVLRDLQGNSSQRRWTGASLIRSLIKETRQ